MKTKLTIIVACDAELGIGIHNALPWHLPEDLAHFKRITMGHTIIMGRNTFESIGRALPNRRNIVLTRHQGWQHDGVEVANSIEATLDLIKNEKEAFLIGGSELFHQMLPLCDQMVMTKIHHTFQCDAFFPKYDTKEWKEIERSTHYALDHCFEYAFVTYVRLNHDNALHH